MRLSVVIPYRPGHPSRAANLATVKVWLGEVLWASPYGATDMLCSDDPSPEFNRGRAINAGVARSGYGDLLAFVDADLVVSGDALRAAFEAVEGGAAMVVPFSTLVALNEEATKRVLSGRSPWGPWSEEDIEYVWDRSVGGVNVLTRATFEAVGGFDPRFAIWGYEDTAFAAAVETLVGPVEWVAATAIHLWHPVDPTRNRELPQPSTELCERYTAARGDKDAMQALIGSR